MTEEKEKSSDDGCGCGCLPLILLLLVWILWGRVNDLQEAACHMRPDTATDSMNVCR